MRDNRKRACDQVLRFMLGCLITLSVALLLSAMDRL